MNSRVTRELWFVDEYEKHTILRQPSNLKWMRGCYGRKHQNEIVSCAGTTFGQVDALKKYVRAICQEISKHRAPHCWAMAGADQAVHNHLLYTGSYLVDKVSRLTYRDGPVVTVGGSAPAYRNEKGDFLKGNRREVAPVVHQYDRDAKNCRRHFLGAHGENATICI